MADIANMPIEHTALYKFALLLYKEYKAAQEHEYTPQMELKLKEVMDHLQLDAYQVENNMVVTYVLDKDQVNANPA